MSVRIYQGHPRDNLIYDSRFFAVHHFNPGTDLPAKRMLTGIAKDFVIFDSSIGLGFDSVFVDTDNDNKDDCWVDVQRTEVDDQVPSYVS
ncbi:MAG TPA: hypothetical protein EYQ86_08435, partial [Bacteroidetes bacterium]|nr:hypothetical protein [Bacteroidota bacterium]